MKFKAAKACFPAFGIDTVQSLSHEACGWLVKNGFSFAVRYLTDGPIGLKAAELQRIVCSGLAVMPVTTSRKPGWAPSGALGKTDGRRAVTLLESLAIPHAVVAWLDLESPGGTSADVAAWVDAWAHEVVSNGFRAGLYVGSGCRLTSDELWERPEITRYWRSCSRVPEPSNRGFGMYQLKPWNHKLGPLVVDVDVIEQDFKGDMPTWAVAA